MLITSRAPADKTLEIMRKRASFVGTKVNHYDTRLMGSEYASLDFGLYHLTSTQYDSRMPSLGPTGTSPGDLYRSSLIVIGPDGENVKHATLAPQP
jgi:hypothetical protein